MISPRNQAGTASELADLQQSTVAILDGSVVSLLNKNPAQVEPVYGGHPRSVHGGNSGPRQTSGFLRPWNHGGQPGAPGGAYRHDHAAQGVQQRRYPARSTTCCGPSTSRVNSGARVINMSFSMEDPSDELLAAISYANSRRVICVASAGNSGKRSLVYPAAWKKVSGIGSTNNADTRSTFSNYGDQLITLAAPGEGLIAAWPFNNLRRGFWDLLQHRIGFGRRRPAGADRR